MLGTGSHHMIVYKDDMDTAEQPVPQDCQPFTGALNTSGKVAPLMITQKSDDELTLPDGVAYTLRANQMIRIELHYINTTDAPSRSRATSCFYAADAATINERGRPLVHRLARHHAPANTMTTLHEFFTVPSEPRPQQSHFFAITGHEHHLGTGVEVNAATELGRHDHVDLQPDPNSCGASRRPRRSTRTFTVPVGRRASTSRARGSTRGEPP